MTGARSFRIHLDPASLRRAQAGGHNFLNKLCEVLAGHGFGPVFLGDGPAERLRSAVLPGWSLVHREPPAGERSLVFRSACITPFWQIDRSEKRWEWDVARARFDPERVDRAEVESFARAWRKRLYSGATEGNTSEDFVFVPLQALLTERRSFQAAAPLEMLEAVLERLAPRPVVATLHPRARYMQDEIVALDRLCARYPRLSVRRLPAPELLRRCAMVVTENSAAAFEALFFRKPALLFAGIDFHHPFASVWRDGMDAAFEALAGPGPAYDAYLWWYLQGQSLNAGKPDIKDRIAARLRALGVPL